MTADHLRLLDEGIYNSQTLRQVMYEGKIT